MAQPIIIDTDPGEDDAIALLLALASPELEVVGITAVAGNAPLSWTEVNARRLCEAAGRTDVPVFAGAERPLVRALQTAPEVHGATGLDGAPHLPAPTMPLQPLGAAEFLVRTILERPPGTVSLCALGPLTNVAQAIMREASLAARLKQIVLMGGAGPHGGNTTPVAEFNIHVDPHAADVVFSSGARIVMAPLDVTHQVLSTPARIARIRALGNRVAETAAGILQFYGRFDQERYRTEGGPLHDPCVIAWLLRPDLFDGRSWNVAVETQSPLTLGQTVIDRRGVTGRRPNARVLTRVDADGFYDLLTERLDRYGRAG
jgi:purine nucleosidase